MVSPPRTPPAEPLHGQWMWRGSDSAPMLRPSPMRSTFPGAAPGPRGLLSHVGVGRAAAPYLEASCCRKPLRRRPDDDLNTHMFFTHASPSAFAAWSGNPISFCQRASEVQLVWVCVEGKRLAGGGAVLGCLAVNTNCCKKTQNFFASNLL